MPLAWQKECDFHLTCLHVQLPDSTPPQTAGAWPVGWLCAWVLASKSPTQPGWLLGWLAGFERVVLLTGGVHYC